MDGLSVKIVLADGSEFTYPLRPRIIVAFEQKFGAGFAKLLGNEQRLEHIYWLGWESLKANGQIVKPFGADFLDTVKTVELISDESFVSTETA
jgi:hypothetical protein